MALTQVQKPSGFVGVNQRLMVVLTSDNVDEPKFRFKVSLYKDTSTLISTSYIDPDPNDFGVYDCSPRLQNIVKPQIDDGASSPVAITNLPSDKCFIEVDGAHEEIRVVIDESYAADVSSEPVDQGIDDEFDFTIYAASSLIENGINHNSGKGVFDTVSAESLLSITGEDGGFKAINVTNDDRYCLAWFNANEDAVTVVKWRMALTFNDGSTAVEDITFSGNEQGAGNGTMCYFMCGPKDLSDFTGIAAANRPSSAIDWDNYIIQPFNASTAIGAGYKFIRDDSSCRYDNYQLMFANTDGAWSFRTFQMVSEKTIQAQGGKSNTTQVGTTDGGSQYTLNPYDRETYEINKQTKVEVELNTNWITREEAVDMEQLIYSPDVYFIYNGSSTPVPAIIKQRSHRHDKYKKLRQYKLTIETAQNYHRL